MPYIELTQLLAMFPSSQLIACLDDNQDGQADVEVWAQVQARVQGRIDAVLENFCALPLTPPVPNKLTEIAAALAVAIAFARRDVAEDKCPFAAAISRAESDLNKIATGTLKLKLGAPISPTVAPKAITEKLATVPGGGRLLA